MISGSGTCGAREHTRPPALGDSTTSASSWAQADRFRAGLIRLRRLETHIAETLAKSGLPRTWRCCRTGVLFNPAAYSKVGAAGLLAVHALDRRRYMRIDSAVDDRLDPFRSTEAAAQLLAYNYRVLAAGRWR